MDDLNSLFEEAKRVAKRVLDLTDLDRFAEFIARGAVITSVDESRISAECGEVSQDFRPSLGLSESIYRRLAYDDLSRALLANGVLKKLLAGKGVSGESTRRAIHSVPEETLVLLVEQFSFEKVTEALALKAAELEESAISDGKHVLVEAERDNRRRSPSVVHDGFKSLEAKLDTIQILVEQISLGQTRLPPEYLSAQDAALFLGIEITSLEHLRKSRKIRAVLVGEQRGFVYAVADLREFASQRTLKTGTEELRNLEARRRKRR